MARKLAVVVALCAASATLVSACGESERPPAVLPGLSTSKMVRAAQAIFDLAASDPSDVVDLSACPLGDFNALLDKAPAEVQASAESDAQPFAYVSQAEGELASVQCGLGDAVAYVGEVPGEHFRQDRVASLPDFVLTFENERAYRGGSVARYCAEPIAAEGESFCGADWFNHQMWVGVFVRGGEPSSANAEDWLMAILGDVVANVPELAPGIHATGVLATAAMVPAIEAVLALGATSSSTSPDLSACPLGDFDELVAKAPAAVTASAAVDGALETYVYQPSGPNEPPHLQCGRGDLGAYTGLVSEGDYHDELIRLLPDFVLTFDDDKPHLGGTIVRFCAEPIGVGFGAFCEADWYDDNVWVGVFIYGETASSALVNQWLTAVLGDIVANVPQVASTVRLAD